jgi:hypothetical protein
MATAHPCSMLRRARRALLLAAAASTIGLASCSSGGSDATPTTERTTTTVPLADPATLIDPGVEPRVALRLRYVEGEVVRLRSVIDLVIDQEADGVRQRLDSPPIAQILELRVAAADDEGATIEMEVVEASVAGEGTDLDEAQLAAAQESIDASIGLRGTLRVDALGRAVDVRFGAPEALGAPTGALIEGLAQQARQLTPSLPVEPVGVGGSWRSTQEVPAAGPTISMTTTTTFTVVAIEDGTVTYEAEAEVAIPAQDLRGEGLAEGEARLQASTGSSSGRGTFRVGSPLAEADVRSSVRQVIELDEADGSVELVQDVTTVLRTGPAPS